MISMWNVAALVLLWCCATALGCAASSQSHKLECKLALPSCCQVFGQRALLMVQQKALQPCNVPSNAHVIQEGGGTDKQCAVSHPSGTEGLHH